MTSSSDSTLAFLDRVKLAQQEQKIVADNRHQEKRKRARVILDTVEAFFNDIKEQAQEKYIQGIHQTDPHSKRQTIQLWEYSLPNKYKKQAGLNARISAVGVEDVDFYTPFILTHGYKRLCQEYFPEENISITQKLETLFSSEEYNNGIDPLTGAKFNICIFTKKGPRSVFRNGIVLSRDGIKYDEEFISKPN